MVKKATSFSKVRDDSSAEAWMQLCHLYTDIAERALNADNDGRAEKFFKLADSARREAGKSKIPMEPEDDNGGAPSLSVLLRESVPEELYVRARGLAEAVKADGDGEG